MIVVNTAPEKAGEGFKEDMSKAVHDMFCKELDAYCAYKEWMEYIEDPVLESAIEEIMFDEYLHAKFLRDFMVDKDIYDFTDADMHEKRFWKIHKKFFRD